MKNFNVICGLPRSGSTLLCNILNQNPKFQTSTSTSCTPMLLNNISTTLMGSSEITSDLISNRKATEERINTIGKSICESAFSNVKADTVFDKARGWIYTLPTLRSLYPNTKIIVTVRNLKDVFASVEKQHLKSPMLDAANDVAGKTSMGRCESLFGRDGMVGSLIYGIEEAHQLASKDVIFLQYEALVDDPELVLRRLYKALGEKPFTHGFDNIIDTSNDVDGLYHYKFPHKGSGKVKAVSDSSRFVCENVSHFIDNAFPYYNKIFNYNQVK